LSAIFKDGWVPPNFQPTFAGAEIISKNLAVSATTTPPVQGQSSRQAGIEAAAASANDNKTPDNPHEWTTEDVSVEIFGKVFMDCTELGCQLRRSDSDNPQQNHVH